MLPLMLGGSSNFMIYDKPGWLPNRRFEEYLGYARPRPPHPPACESLRMDDIRLPVAKLPPQYHQCAQYSWAQVPSE